MTFSQRCYQWNVWYDSLPNEWRFQVALWPLIVLGAINMLLTISAHFPFGLLLLLGFLCLAALRVPYQTGAGHFMPDGAIPAAHPGRAPIQISGMAWAIDWNRRYDAMTELARLCVFPAILAVAGLINMLLTIGNGFPFGMLFLLAIVAVVAIRVPYIRGWFRSSDPVAAAGPVAARYAEIPHAPMTPAITASVEEPAATVASELGPAGAALTVPVMEQPDRVAGPAVAASQAVAAPPPVAAPAETGARSHTEAPSYTGPAPNVAAPSHPGLARPEAAASDVVPPDAAAPL